MVVNDMILGDSVRLSGNFVDNLVKYKFTDNFYLIGF
jgi:hypothetical protein